jgi:hypothetical protein
MRTQHFALSAILTLAVLSFPAGAAQEPDAGLLPGLPAAAQTSILRALRQDTAWQQLAELTASDGTKIDNLGRSVAISGSTVVVGAPEATVGSNQGQGAAYVFVKPASGWKNMTQVAKLTASDGKPGYQFGGSVAIDGDTIFVGNGNLEFGTGGGYVFVKPARGWRTGHETAELACLGLVAVSGDTAVCGGGDAAAIYVKPKTGWKSTSNYDALLVTTDGDKNLSSSITTDGDVVVIGAADINNECDVAYLYVKPKNGWGTKSNKKHIFHQTAKLTNSDSTEGDGFGNSVAISGNTVAVGAPYTADNNGTLGAAYVFVKPAAGWTNMTQTAKLTANTTSYPSVLGWSVAVWGDTLVAGNPSGENTDNHQGEAFVFVKPPGGWDTTSTPNARLTPSGNQEDDPFGWSVAMSGQTILVGDINVAYTEPGAAYVFGH